MYVTPTLKTGLSERQAVTILFSLSGRPFQLDAGGEDRGSFDAVVVAPHVRRSLDATECRLVSFNMDQMSYEYHALLRLLGNRRIYPLKASGFSSFLPRLRALEDGQLDCGSAYRLFNEFVRCISEYRPPNILIDLRVLHVAHRVMEELPMTHTIKELAENVGLSADRLTHLFSEQLGLSIKSYILWAKMRRAVQLFPAGMSLTDVAHSVGFADSAHLTRTFKSYFGLTPSFLADSRYVQVVTC